MQVLTVFQGAPGVGKSTIAEALSAANGAIICSTDAYHFEEGVYKFKPWKLDHFHKLNLERAKSLMLEGKSVIVDNTNIEAAHAKPYIEFAKQLGIAIQIVQVHGRFGNVHGVPTAFVEHMRNRIQDLTYLL